MQNEHKKLTVSVIFATVLMLVAVNIFNPAQFGFKDTTDYDALRAQNEAENEQYRQLLASIEPNYAASQQLLEKIATEDLVRKEVESTLQTNQKITIPTIATAEINVSNRSDKDFVANYLSDTTSMLANYNEAVAPGVGELFAGGADVSKLAKASEQTKKLVENLRGMPVPKDAVDLHKSEIVAFQEYGKIFDTAQGFSQGTTTNPWPTVYNKYAVIDNQLGVAKNQVNTLTQKYGLNDATITDEFTLIKTAHAQFAVSVVNDWQQVVIEGIKAGLARAFASFAITMLDKVVAQIEKNFAIASQLYYSQDLGRFYSVEYLKKFVSDPLDQDIIQKFLPEYFCLNTNPSELKHVFEAKAKANEGSDLVIDPQDPDFLKKLARLGSDEKNYPIWWEGYYESLAQQTKSQAESAAAKEVLSPGIKSGRDLISGQITKTSAAIFNTQEAAISGTINLGTNNTENAISQLIAGVIENLVNKFIFTPITGSGQAGSSGGISIIKDQSVCLKTPQIKPIIPIGDSGYVPPAQTTPPFVPTN